MLGPPPAGPTVSHPPSPSSARAAVIPHGNPLFPSAVRMSAPRKHKLCLLSDLQCLTDGWHGGDVSECLDEHIFLFSVFICFALPTRL